MKKYLLLFLGCVAMAVTAIGFTACDKKSTTNKVLPGKDNNLLVGEWRCNDSYYGSITMLFESDGTGLMIMTEDGYYGSSYDPFLYSYDADTHILTVLYSGGYYGYGNETETFYLQWFGTDKVLVSENDSYYRESWGLFIRQ